MRLFVAINLSDEIKAALLAAIARLERSAKSGRYTDERNLHLTLAFIGETHRVDAAKAVLDSLDFKRFDITLSGSGRFRRNGGDIYWAGIERNNPLERLASALSGALRRADFDIEIREFKAHITLGREIMADGVIGLDIPKTTMCVGRISLMKSERINGGMVYTEIYGKDADIQRSV